VASGFNASALGYTASASGAQSTASGFAANASGSNATAYGTGSQATGPSSTAVGQGAIASGMLASAFGQGAVAAAPGSVAIGAGSVASQPNTVSFGTPGNERRLTNVAPGIAGTDGVNLNQLASGLGALQNQISNNVNRANAGTASALATAGLRYDDRPGKISSAFALGGYGGQYGLAGGVGYTSESQLWRFNAAATASPSNTRKTDFGFVAGVSYTWN
jgi:autotransporter adhesin